jgi:hypothetical protein
MLVLVVLTPPVTRVARLAEPSLVLVALMLDASGAHAPPHIIGSHPDGWN